MAAVLDRATVGARMVELRWTDFDHPEWEYDVYLDLNTTLVRMVGYHVDGTQSDSDWHGCWWRRETAIWGKILTVQIHHRGNLGRLTTVHFIERRRRWLCTNYAVNMKFLSFIDLDDPEAAESEASWIVVPQR